MVEYNVEPWQAGECRVKYSAMVEGSRVNLSKVELLVE